MATEKSVGQPEGRQSSMTHGTGYENAKEVGLVMTGLSSGHMSMAMLEKWSLSLVTGGQDRRSPSFFPTTSPSSQPWSSSLASVDSENNNEHTKNTLIPGVFGHEVSGTWLKHGEKKE